MKEQVNVIKDLAHYLEIDVMLIKRYINYLNYLKAIFSLRSLKEKSYNLIDDHYMLSGLLSLFQWKITIFVTCQCLISGIITTFPKHFIPFLKNIEE